jgi:hypothetical protein
MISATILFLKKKVKKKKEKKKEKEVQKKRKRKEGAIKKTKMLAPVD